MMKRTTLLIAAVLVLGLFRAGQAAIEDWSTTAASNNSAAPDGFPEGMAPSAVNNAARELMAQVARWAKQYTNATTAHDGGSADAYSISPAIVQNATRISGAVYRLKANATSTSTQPTLSVNGETGITIKKLSGVTLDTGDIQKNLWHQFVYDGTNYILQNPFTITSGQLSQFTSFFAYNSTSDTNATGDGTTVTIEFDTEKFDDASNFDNSTDTFTAPVTGRYRFDASAVLSSLGASHTQALLTLVTTGGNYRFGQINIGAVRDSSNSAQISGTVTVAMTAGDTATVTTIVSGSTKTVSVGGATGNFGTYFSGTLVR